MPSVFEGKNLVDHSLNSVDAAKVVGDADLVVVYFSAHWCPPCQRFTPMLKTFHAKIADPKVVIIFVSCDRDKASMESYFKTHGEYYAVPFGDGLGDALNDTCGVSGIPMLCVVNKDGDALINGNARGAVEQFANGTNQQCKAVVTEWKEAAKK